jgi:hypothetical protein
LFAQFKIPVQISMKVLAIAGTIVLTIASAGPVTAAPPQAVRLNYLSLDKAKAAAGEQVAVSWSLTGRAPRRHLFAVFAASFAADVAPERAAFMADSQVPWGVEALNGTISQAAWKAKPSWYLVVTDDKMIPHRHSGSCPSVLVRQSWRLQEVTRSTCRGLTPWPN